MNAQPSRLSPAQLERLTAEIERARYRERHARAILRVLAIVGIASLIMAAVASCSLVTPLCYERTDGTTQHFATDAERRNHQASTATNISR